MAAGAFFAALAFTSVTASALREKRKYIKPQNEADSLTRKKRCSSFFCDCSLFYNSLFSFLLVFGMQSWKRFEYRIVEHLRKLEWYAHRVPVSGAASVIKGDVIASRDGIRLRIDAKSTASKDGIRISVEDIEKNARNCKDGEIPVVVFSFRRHRRLYAVLQAGDAALFAKQRQAVLRSERSILLRRKDVFGLENDECLVLQLRDGRRYTVAELDAFLERLQRAEEAI